MKSKLSDLIVIIVALLIGAWYLLLSPHAFLRPSETYCKAQAQLQGATSYTLNTFSCSLHMPDGSTIELH